MAWSVGQHMVGCAVTLPRSGEGVLRHASWHGASHAAVVSAATASCMRRHARAPCAMAAVRHGISCTRQWQH